MNADVKLMNDIGEPYAAGFLEFPDGPLPRTYCRAYRRYLETKPLVYKENAPLFPAGDTRDKDRAVKFCFAQQYEVNWDRLREKSPLAAEAFGEFNKKFRYVGGWIHGVLNFRRILSEGVNRYEERVKALEEGDFRSALLDALEGIRTYHSRALDHLLSVNAPKMLTDALKKVPFSPADTAYEAIVSINFMLSLDGWDNIGRIDALLAPYHKGEDLRPYLRRLMQNIQDNMLWSVTLGPDYNDITRQVIECSKGLARPLVQLRVTKDMPEDLWQLALSHALSGGGQPSFYNEEAIQRRLKARLPDAPKEDIYEFTGGGCTETCFAGLTYSGATDYNLSVLLIFEEYMWEALGKSKSFEEFYSGFCARLADRQDALMAEINDYYNERANICFAPVRTLFVDDCIENGKGYFQGGARYSYAINSDSGVPNTIDSLLAVKKLVFETKEYTPEAFLSALGSEDPELFAKLKKCPCHGVGDDEADSLTFDLTSRLYARYKTGKLDIGIGFLPTAHQFLRHIDEGQLVGATPDGRPAHTPLADSIGAVGSKAVKGPTALLKSASQYNQEDTYGIAVLNLTVTQKYPPEVMRALVEGYFSMDGTQIQITAVDRETLIKAKADPESHRELIVRVGGYSDHFYKLSDELKDAVISRNFFE